MVGGVGEGGFVFGLGGWLVGGGVGGGGVFGEGVVVMVGFGS